MKDNSFSLEGKTIVVTGGNGLLGHKICESLLANEARVVSLDVKESDNLTTHKNLTQKVVDVSDAKKAKEIIAELSAEYGQLDAWVNNAYPRTETWAKSVEELDPESWSVNVDLQLNSYCMLAWHFCDYLKKSQHKSGSVVNIGSIYGLLGNDFNLYEDSEMLPPASYTAIKGGVINFTKYLASRYGKDGIRVNVVCPGGIYNKGQPEKFLAEYERKTPMKRLGYPEEVGSVVAFLVSNAASYVSGVSLPVDGGWTAV